MNSRLLDELDDTIALAKEFERTGISAIGIHGRKKKERPQHENNSGFFIFILFLCSFNELRSLQLNCSSAIAAIRTISQHLKIPVIANGGSREIQRFNDIEKFRAECGTTSVMIARAAEWNVSIFRRDGKQNYILSFIAF